jgi:hypothetical protein
MVAGMMMAGTAALGSDRAVVEPKVKESTASTAASWNRSELQGSPFSVFPLEVHVVEVFLSGKRHGSLLCSGQNNGKR